MLEESTVTEIEENRATVSWTMSDYSRGQVLYGTTESLGSATTLESRVRFKSHVQSLSGLSAATDYFYQIIGEDQDGNKFSSELFTFRTAEASQAPVENTNLTLGNLGGGGIR